MRCRSGVTGHGRRGCSRRRQLSQPGRQGRHGKPAERFPFRRSPRLRRSTRLSGSRAAAGSSGGVTGGLLVQLAAARGARVLATASATKAERVRAYGASEVLDYQGDWPVLVREITGGGAPKAVNAARGQAATTLKAVADGGRLATITGDPPGEERGVAVSDVYVRPDGRQLSALAELLALGSLSVPIASVRPLEQAAQALREVVAGADGAIVLSLRT
ncbi:MAG: zinc-binding dehydrogenase [Actinobacteria bacterium]|nr:MAG: zinc-binding dehydrogenase [Actinomycetota bacterium]